MATPDNVCRSRATHRRISTNVQQNAELSGGNLLGRWERDLGSGSNVQLQTYYDRTNRKQANFAESRDTFDIDFIHHLILPGRRTFCGASERA